MNPIETVSQDGQNPMEGGWIALAPVHLFPGVLLLAELLQDVLYGFLPYEFHAQMFVAWGFTLLRWVLGGLALAAAFQARSQKSPGDLRQAAFGLAAIVLGLRICLGLVMPFAFRMGTSFYPISMVSHHVLMLMCLGALILLMIGRQEDSGGGFDGAVAALVFAGGLGWVGLPVLVFAAMKGHPLLAAQWQALRNPKAAMEGGWFDGLDEGLWWQNLGACSLACAVAFLALIGRLFLGFSHGNSFGPTTWWASADIAAAALACLPLAIHVIRRARGRKGRGTAIAAILVVGAPLLLLLVGIIFLVLILTDVIHFRLF